MLGMSRCLRLSKSCRGFKTSGLRLVVGCCLALVCSLGYGLELLLLLQFSGFPLDLFWVMDLISFVLMVLSSVAGLGIELFVAAGNAVLGSILVGMQMLICIQMILACYQVLALSPSPSSNNGDKSNMMNGSTSAMLRLENVVAKCAPNFVVILLLWVCLSSGMLMSAKLFTMSHFNVT